MMRIRTPAMRATSGVIWAAVISIGFPMGFVLRGWTRAGRDEFGGRRALDLNAQTAVWFYATNAAVSSPLRDWLCMSARASLSPLAGRGRVRGRFRLAQN